MVRPSISDSNKHYSFHDVETIFPKLQSFIERCMNAGAYFSHFDCPFPLCKLSINQINFLWRHLPSPERIGRCYTHVDIQSEMKISSCFCSYNFNDLYFSDFDDFNECRNFIMHYEDKLRWDKDVIEECRQCIYRNLKICQGGCLGYSRKNQKITLNKKDLLDYRNLEISKVDKINFDNYKKNFQVPY